jgi:anti-sigma factor RsiW
MLTCKQFTAFLDRYLAGELPPDLRPVFDDHLAQCTSCARYLGSYAATVTLAAGAAERGNDAAPREFPPRLLQSILQARRGTRH